LPGVSAKFWLAVVDGEFTPTKGFQLEHIGAIVVVAFAAALCLFTTDEAFRFKWVNKALTTTRIKATKRIVIKFPRRKVSQPAISGAAVIEVRGCLTHLYDIEDVAER